MTNKDKPLSERVTRRGNIKAEFVKKAVERLNEVFKGHQFMEDTIKRIFGEIK